MNPYTGTENLEVMAEAVNYNRFLLDLVCAAARKGDRIVDFGAGIGTFAAPLQQAGYDVCCVEPDAAQLHLLRGKGLNAVESIDRVPPGTVDYLYTLNVLEHIAEDRVALQSIRRTFRDGGRLLIYVPAFMVLFTGMDRRVGHVRRYTSADLVGKVKAAGFSVERAEYVDSIGFLATLFYRLTADSSGAINRRMLRIYDSGLFPLSRVVDRAGMGRIPGKNLLVVARAV